MNDEAGRQARSDTYLDDAASVAPAPAVVIRIEIEAAPRVLFEVMTDGANGRLADWLASHPEYLALVSAALELGDQARAA